MQESVIAKNVKSIIRKRGLKQKFVAERAGIKLSTFSNMMNGRKVITDVDVMSIANALQVEANDLFKREGKHDR